MPSTITIADAVVSVLNAGSFSQEFTAERKWHAIRDRKAFNKLRVTVVASEYDDELETRSSLEERHTVDIGVQKNVDADDNSAIDPMHALAREIMAHLRRTSLGIDGVTWIGSGIPILADPEELHISNQFVSIVRMVYRASSSV